MVRTFALILAFITVLSATLLTACKGNYEAPQEAESVNSSAETEETSMTPDENGNKGITSLTIGGHDISEFTVFYTHERYEEYAKLFCTLLKAECGTELKVQKFTVEAAMPRIILGTPESADWIAPCSPDRALSLTEGNLAHVIEQKDGVLVLAGADEWTVYDVLHDFINIYIQGRTGAVVIGDISQSSKTTAAYESNANAEMRVMTLNTYATNGNYTKRFPYMVALIERYMPDIIGMQEVNERVYSSVIGKLPKSYKVAQNYIDGSDSNNYTPIVYRKDKYALLETSVRFLRQRYEGTNTKTITFAVFERLDTGEKFGIINLHGAIILASYNLEETNKVEGAKWREDNMKQMLETMEELREKYPGLPIIFTGDFNCNKSSDAYKTAISGGLSDAEFNATDARVTGIKTHHDVGVFPDEGKSIDHIFYTEGATARVHNIVTEVYGLNATDHCAVYADFVFEK